MKPLMKYHCKIQTPDGAIIDTWGVYPILNNSKILDGIYDPEAKALKLLFDSVKENLEQMQIPKANGKFEDQLRKVDMYYKGSINEEDLEFFLNTYVDNNFEYKEKGLIITDEQ